MRQSLHRTLALSALLAAAGTFVAGQAGVDQKQLARLKQLFPSAATFSPKEGEPAHFTAYAPGGSGNQGVLGYAFWTTEVVPLERGYGGPIVMLVGINLKGLLTGVIVAEHHEPYGDFSVDRAEFAEQFKGKNIRDSFKVGADIDAVSRATISVTSASRSVRNSARRIARQLLAPPEAGK